MHNGNSNNSTSHNSRTVIEQLYETQELVEYCLADVLMVDKTHYLELIEHQIELQKLLHRWFQFVKFVKNNAVSPFICATAEMELQSLLELVTKIEPREIIAISTNFTVNAETP